MPERFKNSPKNPERGSVLLLVVMLISLLMFIPIGAQLLKTAREQVRRFSNSDAQALNVARAGLTDAIAWFQRQGGGLPVRTGNPVSPYPDSAFLPLASSSDTINQALGLVKEDALSPIAGENKLYYRYEVVRQSTDNVATPSFNNPHAVHDVTDQRIEGKLAGDGLVWYIESVGYVFSRRDASLPFDAPPNRVVGRARVATEITRLNVQPSPASAVIIGQRANGVVNANCFIRGGTTVGATWASTSTAGAGTWGAGTLTTGTGSNTQLFNTATLTVQSLFGVAPNDLRLLADHSVDQVSDLPAEFPRGSLVYVNGNAVFSSSRPLTGNGVLVVNGNLTIPAGTNSNFSGLIHVTGNANITGNATISGALVVTGTLTMTASGPNGVTIFYDSDALDLAAKDTARYRENRAVYHIFSAFK